MSGVHVSVLSYGPEIVKNCILFVFLADVSNRPKAVIAVYVYALESSHFCLLENGIGYYAMTYSLEDTCV